MRQRPQVRTRSGCLHVQELFCATKELFFVYRYSPESFATIATMKITLLNKILIPALSILITSTVLSALFISNIVEKRLETHTLSMLQASNVLLTKNIRTIANTYLSNIQTISKLHYLRELADDLENPLTNRQHLNHSLQRVQDILEAMPESYQLFLNICFASLSGKVVATSNANALGKVNVHDRQFFQRALHGKTNFSRPQFSKAVGEKCIIVAAPVRTSSHKVGGVVFFIVPCRWLAADTIDEINLSSTGYSYLVDFNSGLMLAHPVFEKVQRMNMFYYQPWMKTLSPSESGLMTDYVDSQGRRRLAAFHMEPTSGWIAVSCLDANEVEQHGAEIRNLICALTLLSTLIVAAMLYLIIRSMTADVSFISRYAHDVAGGDLDKTLKLTRDDELGVLADALRSMVLTLQKPFMWKKSRIRPSAKQPSFSIPVSIRSMSARTASPHRACISISPPWTASRDRIPKVFNFSPNAVLKANFRSLSLTSLPRKTSFRLLTGARSTAVSTVSSMPMKMILLSGYALTSICLKLP